MNLETGEEVTPNLTLQKVQAGQRVKVGSEVFIVQTEDACECLFAVCCSFVPEEGGETRRAQISFLNGEIKVLSDDGKERHPAEFLA